MQKTVCNDDYSCLCFIFDLMFRIKFLLPHGRKQQIYKTEDCHSRQLSSLPNLTYYLKLLTLARLLTADAVSQTDGFVQCISQ